MQTMGYILGLIVPVGLTVMFYILRDVTGDMCSTLVSASEGEDLSTLQEKAFAAFRGACRSKKKNIHVCTFVTEPAATRYSYNFILEPLTMPFHLNFKVKAPRHVMIALAEDRTDQSVFIEIMIGGGYKEAYIRACMPHLCINEPGGKVHTEYNVPGLLSSSEYRPFWITYNEGVVQVGKGGEEKSFLEWDAGAYHGRVPTELHVGISTWERDQGSWDFCQ